jgi:putative FmdB family regulatory protein
VRVWQVDATSKYRIKTFIIQGFGRFLRELAMPIYAYRCADCGFTKDALQKISDAPLTVCPSCGNAAFSKQLTAAGFQLKGTGWYATDFRNGSTTAPAKGAEMGGDKPAASSSATDAPGGPPAAATPTAATPAPTT